MKPAIFTIILFALASCGPSTPPPLQFGYPMDDVLRMNHAQLKGTHNSYHLKHDPMYSPAMDYAHPPLTDQLEKEGVRQLELDIHWMPDDARFAVFHVPGIDDNSNCHWLSDCIGEIREWSDLHRGHAPLFIFLEPKDEYDALDAQIVDHLEDLDAEVKKAWPDRLLTPDDVRGKHATLAEALDADGWPTLGKTRGFAMFVLLKADRSEGHPIYGYTHGLMDLAGRAMFATGNLDDPWGAVLSLEDPVHDDADVVAAVKRNRLVRTLVDDGHDSDQHGTAQRDAAVNGHAHIISSDYPVAGILPNYDVDLAGGTPERCHPLTAPKGCTSEAIESPNNLQPLRIK